MYKYLTILLIILDTILKINMIKFFKFSLQLELFFVYFKGK